MSHPTEIQEAFSEAYVRAVAASAECIVEKRHYDADGVDLSILAPNLPGSPSLYVQLKSTGQSSASSNPQYIRQRLRRKHYDDLRKTNVTCDHVLVVVLVPPDIGDWIDQSESRLAMRRCGYWASLAGKPPLPPGQKSTTVYLPRTQSFTVNEVKKLFGGS